MEGMLNVQQLNINLFVTVNLVTMVTHTSDVTELSAMKTKIVQMIKYVRITCVKYLA